MNDQLQVPTQQIIPIRPIKPKKVISPNSLLGKRKDGKPAQRSCNSRQLKFITNHFLGMSDRKAALTAGYSESMANTASLHLRRNPLIAAEINRIVSENRKMDDFTPERIISNLTVIADANLADYYEYD